MSSKCTFLLALLAVVVLANVRADPDRPCVIGKSYNDGCNNCWCTGSPARGTFTACTLKACPEKDPVTGEVRYKTPNPPPADYWADY